MPIWVEGEVGDVRVGELLSRAPEGPDGAWPCIPVCEAMEAVASEALARGFAMGKRNLRGVIAGDPVPKDRALADTFRRWSESRRMDFPFVSTVLLDLAGIVRPLGGDVGPSGHGGQAPRAFDMADWPEPSPSAVTIPLRGRGDWAEAVPAVGLACRAMSGVA